MVFLSRATSRCVRIRSRRDGCCAQIVLNATTLQLTQAYSS